MSDQAAEKGGGLLNLIILIVFLIGALVVLRWALATMLWLAYTFGGLILLGLIVYFVIKASKKT
ncbi:MAG: hypothetical protein L6R28_11610 [Planctomycetes bacterium]|nr:hypothetical protein [Planctomycetota bacterium]